MSGGYGRRVSKLPNLLVFVFNGQPCEVARKDVSGKLRPLVQMMDEASRLTGNDRYWLDRQEMWDARDVSGTVLDPQKPVTKLKERGTGDIFINMRPGIGA